MLRHVRYYLSSHPEESCKKGVLGIFSEIHRKTPVLKCLFNKVQGLRPAASLKNTPAEVFSRKFCETF